MNGVFTIMPAPTPNPTPPSQKSLRVIYADDQRDLREILRMSLARDGHGVECLPDGRAAWERLVGNHAAIDLVVTDHFMPEMNGLELVMHLRTLPYRGKIVVFSSELSAEVTNAYLALKVDRLLHKPIFPSEFRRVLAELFGPLSVRQPA